MLANLGASFALDTRMLQPVTPTVRNLRISGPGWKVRWTDKRPAAEKPGAPNDPGMSAAAKAAIAERDLAKWADVSAPPLWAEMNDADGEAVFRRSVDLPPSLVGIDLVLNLGTVDDFDVTFVNGTEVGRTGADTKQWWNSPRAYRIPAALTTSGHLDIAVRVWDNFGGGGIGGERDQTFISDPRPVMVQPSLYDPDYRTDFELGDDPYRYYRW